MPLLHAACESNNGCVRRHNEDNYCCITEPEGFLFAAVADGVGGHAGGEIASFLCCHRLLLEWKNLIGANRELPDTLMPRFLLEAIQTANSDIVKVNFEQHRAMPMCTTVAAAVFTPQMVIAAHAGDSRIYCFQENRAVWQLTVDHTLRNELSERGEVPPDGGEPPANVISQAVGMRFKLRPEIHTYFRSPGDRYLLCSDGLTGALTDAEIGKAVEESRSPREATDNLIRATLRRGASDNVTVISIFPQY